MGVERGAIDEDAFLRLAWDIYGEREAMFLNALETQRPGGLRLRYQRPYTTHVLPPAKSGWTAHR